MRARPLFILDRDMVAHPHPWTQVETVWGLRASRARWLVVPVLALLAACSEGAGQDEGGVAHTAGVPALAQEAARCSSCHADITNEYARTNKHASLTRFEVETALERFDVPTRVYHAEDNLWYDVEVRGDSLWQREFRVDAAGDTVHDLSFPAAWVIGSGNATRSYLMNVDGYLTEMPLTWYVESGRWDMSPGYREANDRFSRKISLECLTCHTALPEHSSFTQNDFPDVPAGISCARCHGPVESHVAARSAGWAPAPGQPDTTIVHPGRLDRDAQLANCQQCHLAGVAVFEEGEDPTTFRPGQALSENRAVFVPSLQLTDPEWVGIDSHPLRLARSACYQATEMTCTTCHDPHRAGERLPEDYYNQRCASCHTPEQGGAGDPVAMCSRPGAHDSGEAATGDCVGCHLQRGGTSDVPHVRFTDHWIRRDPGPPRNPDEGRPAFDTADPLDLVALQEEGRPAHDLSARTTDTPQERVELAAAYFHFYETMHRVPAYLDDVIEAAREGLQNGGDHVEGRIALARALAQRDSLSAADQVIAEAQEEFPGDAWVHFWRGVMLADQGQPAAAVPHLQRAVSIQPRFIEAQVELANTVYATGDVDGARAELEKAVQLDPVHQPRAWFNLGVVHLGQGRPESARAAFERASSLDPDFVDAHVQYAVTLSQAGRAADAERAIARALAADADHVPALGTAALLRLQRGDTAGARAALQRVLQLDPGNASARQLLARIGR